MRTMQMFVVCLLSAGCTQAPAPQPAPEFHASARQEREAPRPAPQVSDTQPVAALAAMPITGDVLGAVPLRVLDSLTVVSVEKLGPYAVISQNDISAHLGMESIKDAAGCDGVKCSSEIAGALGARYLLWGSVEPLGGKLLLSLSIFDTVEQRSKHRGQAKLSEKAETFDLGVDRAVRDLFDLPVAGAQNGGARRIAWGKSAPRVLLMIAEQYVGPVAKGDYWYQNQDRAWWTKTETFSIDIGAVEAAFIEEGTQLGANFVDRQTLKGKLSVEPPADPMMRPGTLEMTVFAAKAGADIVIIGKAIAMSRGPSLRPAGGHMMAGTISLRAIQIHTARILGTVTEYATVMHADPSTGGIMALKEVGNKSARKLLQKIKKRM